MRAVEVTVSIQATDADVLLEAVEQMACMVGEDDAWGGKGDSREAKALKRLHRAVRRAVQEQVYPN